MAAWNVYYSTDHNAETTQSAEVMQNQTETETLFLML